MRRILKYQFTEESVDGMRVPAGKVIHVGEQRNGPGSSALPTVWVETSDYFPESRSQVLAIVATGGKPINGWSHVGTAICLNGALVWHVYTSHKMEAPVSG
jgi:hypothetical protein